MPAPPSGSTRAYRLRSNPWLIFTVIGLGSFLGPLSGSITNVALPSIGEFFHTDMQSTKWVVLAYLMVSTFMLPIAGKWGQRYGEGRLYATGLAIYFFFSMTSAMTAYAPHPELLLLVASRAVQAFGSSLMFATGGAMVARYIPVARRGFAFGMVGSIVAMALISGPVIGGLICAKLQWNMIFWVLVPVAALGYIASRIMLPRENPPDMAVPLPSRSSVAWLLVVVGFTLIGEAFSKGLWFNYLWLTGLLTLLALLGFIVSERYGPSLFDYSMFKIMAFRMSAQGAIMINVIMFVLIFLMPFYLEIYLGVPLTRIGMLLGAAPLCSFFFGPLSGHLADKVGFRIPIIAGLSMMLAGFGMLVYATYNESLWQIGLGLALLGAGSGTYGGPNFAAMMSSVSSTQRPLASSFGSLTRNLGFLAGTSLGSIALGLFLDAFHHGYGEAARTEVLSPQAVPEPAFVYAYSRVLMLCVVMCLIGLLASLRFPVRPAHIEPINTITPG
jgi:MFS family permease